MQVAPYPEGASGRPGNLTVLGAIPGSAIRYAGAFRYRQRWELSHAVAVMPASVDMGDVIRMKSIAANALKSSNPHRGCRNSCLQAAAIAVSKLYP